MNLSRSFEKLKNFGYFPESVLFSSFLLSVLNLDLVASNLSVMWLSEGVLIFSIEGVLFLKILFTTTCAYLLTKELKKHYHSFWVFLVASQLLFTPFYIENLRSLSLISLLIPFLVLSLNLGLRYRRKRRPVRIESLNPPLKKMLYICYAFLIFTSLIEIYFVLHSYSLQSRFGRVKNIPGFSLEMTLKMKKYIYSLADQTPAVQDPFMTLHGRAINKMRANEMNRSQTQADFTLYRSQSRLRVNFDLSLKDLAADNSWLFQLRNLSEMALEPQRPFLLTELKAESLPQQLVIKYLNEKAEGIEKVDWPNTNLILPLAFVTKPRQIKILRLEFNLDARTNKFLNVLFDEQTIYKVLQVKINSRVKAPYEKYSGSSETQSQLIYKIWNNEEIARVVIELKVETNHIPNFSRLDVFTTAYALSNEELEVAQQ